MTQDTPTTAGVNPWLNAMLRCPICQRRFWPLFDPYSLVYSNKVKFCPLCGASLEEVLKEDRQH